MKRPVISRRECYKQHPWLEIIVDSIGAIIVLFAIGFVVYEMFKPLWS